MPIIRGRDSYGSYYKFGEKGTKYYYTTSDTRSRKAAYDLAKRQGAAIKISQIRHSF